MRRVDACGWQFTGVGKQLSDAVCTGDVVGIRTLPVGKPIEQPDGRGQHGDKNYIRLPLAQ